jgi:hypothetical protein
MFGDVNYGLSSLILRLGKFFVKKFKKGLDFSWTYWSSSYLSEG